MKYQLDKIVKDNSDYIAYVHILDDKNNIIVTKSLLWKNKNQFKDDLNLKIAKIKVEYEEKQTKIAEIEQALLEMEAK